MKLFPTVLILAACSGADVAAHENAVGVVKERMELMERFDELADRIFAMIHGELAYDPAAVRRAAEEIAEGAGRHLTALFPEGSGGAPSEASPAIWRESGTFGHYAAMLEDWSRELAAEAGNQPRGRLPLPAAAALPGRARIVIHHPRSSGSRASRLLAGQLRRAGAGEVEIREVGFAVRKPSVRYFRPGDRAMAAATCGLAFGPCRGALGDFTGYRPSPRRGTVEIWLP
ncbi:c-type cytochrome [Mangrovicoccus ximenensis]|uniref:c-type cytochrome n=1 Tax=Mangrovicoccus ximenensis TaxID=1911570 RepID=UPI000D367E4A|nr:cytochrome c [Mangrovicoccus ximenensis]